MHIANGTCRKASLCIGAAERSMGMAGGKTFKRDQKRRKEMARKLKQEEKLKKKLERREAKKHEGEEGAEGEEEDVALTIDPSREL